MVKLTPTTRALLKAEVDRRRRIKVEENRHAEQSLDRFVKFRVERGSNENPLVRN